jgi:hypothetical protein
MLDWLVTVMFFGMAVLIIASLIAEFRGGSPPSGDVAAEAEPENAP